MDRQDGCGVEHATFNMKGRSEAFTSPFFDADDRRYIYDAKLPPTNTLIWVAAYIPEDDVFFRHGADIEFSLAPDPPTFGAGEAYCSTMLIGHFAFQLLSIWRKRLDNKRGSTGIELNIGRGWLDKTIPIWPPDIATASARWPPEPGGVSQGERQPEQRRQLLDAPSELQDLLPEFRLREVRRFQSYHDPGRRCEPSTRRRSRDPEIGGDGQVSGTLDEIPEPMVIALLRPGHGRHLKDDRPIAHIAQILQEDAGRRPARRELAHENTKCRWR